MEIAVELPQEFYSKTVRVNIPRGDSMVQDILSQVISFLKTEPVSVDEAKDYRLSTKWKALENDRTLQSQIDESTKNLRLLPYSELPPSPFPTAPIYLSHLPYSLLSSIKKSTTLSKYTFEGELQGKSKITIPLPPFLSTPSSPLLSSPPPLQKNHCRLALTPSSLQFILYASDEIAYRFGVPKLQVPIDPQRSDFLIRNGKAIITLVNAVPTDVWTSLHYKRAIGDTSDPFANYPNTLVIKP